MTESAAEQAPPCQLRHRTALWLCARLTRLAFLVIAKVRVGEVDLRRIGGRGAIIASNHRSLLDFFVATVVFREWGLCPRTLVRSDLFTRPWLGRALRLVGAIPAGRGRGLAVTIGEAAEVLRQGGVVAMAPEGRVRASGQSEELGDLRSGVGILGSRCGTPILVAALVNTDVAWPLDRRTPVLHLPWNRPTVTVSVRWLEVPVGAPPSEVTSQVAHALRELVEGTTPH